MKLFVLSPDIEFPPRESDNRNKIISVFLRGNSSEIANFRCIFCGRIAFQYCGDVVQIYDGAKLPEDKTTLDILCHLCKIKFRVGSI